MVCACCASIPYVSIRLFATVLATIYGHRMLVPSSFKKLRRWTFMASVLAASALSAWGTFLCVLSWNPELRARTAATIISLGHREETPMDAHRCAVVERGRVEGRVLEFGPGPGSNFKCFPKGKGRAANSTTSPGGSIKRYTGVDPNGYFRDMLHEAKERANLTFPIDVVGVKGEEWVLPAADRGSYDVVLSTHLLCSVESPELVLRNAVRALKPRGRYIFFEHVAAEHGSIISYYQRCVANVLYILADGCQFSDTEKVLKNAFSEDQFDLEITRFDAPLPQFMAFLRPHIMGVATKK